jgi:hypothetical protein
VTSYQSSTGSVTGEQRRWPPFALVARRRDATPRWIRTRFDASAVLAATCYSERNTSATDSCAPTQAGGR